MTKAAVVWFQLKVSSGRASVLSSPSTTLLSGTPCSTHVIFGGTHSSDSFSKFSVIDFSKKAQPLCMFQGA